MADQKTIAEKLRISRLTWLHWASIGAFVASFIFPAWYKYIFTVLLVVPLIGLLMGFLKGRPSVGAFWSEENDITDRTDPVDYILIAGLAMTLETSDQFQFENLSALIIPTIGIIAFMSALVFVTHRPQSLSSKGATLNYIVLFVYLGFYSIGACMGINSLYDNSPEQEFSVTVLEKRDHYSRSSSERNYYLKTTPWGTHTEPQQMAVSNSLYYNVEEGSAIRIVTGHGLFGASWYYAR